MAPRANLDSVRCIVPPHILDAIVRNGSPAQRASALNTLGIDVTIRSLRFARTMAPRAVCQTAPIGDSKPAPKRSIHAASAGGEFPGARLRWEGSAPTGDSAVDEAYDGLGAAFDLFFQVFERDSIDGRGAPLQATVHYGTDYENAYWDGVQLVLGGGDKQLFQRFTIAVEVIGHELTHGVIGAEANLQYMNQSGALNESLADVFGSLIKQYARQESVTQADWLIGSGLFTRQVNGRALRSLSAPGQAYDDTVLGRDPQPDHMRDYVQTMRDNGGVHINSGIPNRAFFLTAMAIGGVAWAAPGKIWYATLRDPRLRPDASFRDFARLCEQHAAQLYGHESTEHAAVRAAWEEVGVPTD